MGGELYCEIECVNWLYISPLGFYACTERCEGDNDQDYELSSDEIAEAQERSANIVGLDFAITTPRFGGSIWSWAANEPASSDYAYQNSDDEWAAHSAGWNVRVACQSVLDGSWAIPTGYVHWSAAGARCASLGSEWVFAAPVNTRMNKDLADVKHAKGLANVWLNASDHDSEGNWVVHNVVDRTELNDSPLVAGWDDGHHIAA